jgi:hypothetical protein
MPNTYVSPSGTYSLEYPDSWKLLREADGTVRIWRKAGLLKKESVNSLRIKPFVSSRIILHDAFESLAELRKSEGKDVEVSQNAELFAMNFQVIKYRREMTVNAVTKTIAMIQLCWDLVIGNRIFSASFTFPKDQENAGATQEEKTAAENILYSLKLR